MLKRKLLFLFIFFTGVSNLSSQNNFLNKDFDYYFESKANFDSLFHFTIKPYERSFYDSEKIKTADSKNSFLYGFFNNDLINIKKKQLRVIVNPILNTVFYDDLTDNNFFEDYKVGLNLKVNLTKRLFLNSAVFIAESGFPSYYNDLITKSKIVPHYGKYLKTENNSLVYYSWTGSINYHANDHILFSAGKGKHFLGNGYRSLFLSDNSNVYPFVKAEVDIWKIKYLWMFAKFSDIDLSPGADPLVLYDKAAFIHYFSLNLTKRINFDFFETVITNPFDSEGRRISYDAVYFNPVVFYRPIEFYKGTSDNSLMGIGLNIRLWKSCFLYSQFILDDLLISSLKDKSGWWGNKFGIQAGVKAYNVFKIKGLFVRSEINIVRPYTYSHGEAYTNKGIANLNYGNFRQEAAHPFGANFAEGIAVIRYVKGRFSAETKFILIKKGEDADTLSYGGDVYKSYNLRPDDYGVLFLQGNLTDYHIFDIGFSWLLNSEYGLMFKTGFYGRNKFSTVNTEKNRIFYFGLSSSLFN